jgi:hypothetical protein
MRTLIAAVAACLILAIAPADARGSFSCGKYMSRVTGAPYTPLAREWATKFPHTSAGPGAVVVQSRKGRALGGGPGGHVSRIVEMISTCRAIVNDNRGTYERDICRNLIAYVRPERS